MNPINIFKYLVRTSNRSHLTFWVSKRDTKFKAQFPSSFFATSSTQERKRAETGCNDEIAEEEVQPVFKQALTKRNTYGELNEKFNSSINRRLMKLAWESNWDPLSHEDEWDYYRGKELVRSQSFPAAPSSHSHHHSNAAFYRHRPKRSSVNGEDYISSHRPSDQQINQLGRKHSKYSEEDSAFEDASHDDINHLHSGDDICEPTCEHNSFLLGKGENTKSKDHLNARKYHVTAHFFSSGEVSTRSIKEKNTSSLQSVHEDVTKITQQPFLSTKNLSEIRPVRPSKSFNLASIVNDSHVLSNLVKLGMDLSQAERDPEVASFLAKMNWEKDVVPYLLFLHDLEVPDDKLGEVLSVSPGLFMEDLDNLQARVNYFRSKHFSNEAITRIMTVAPKIFLMTVEDIDAQLGFLQKRFSLTGDDVRYIIKRYPRLILIKKSSIEGVLFNLEEVFGFTKEHQKQILLKWPKTFNYNIHSVTETYEYLHQEIGLTHEVILKWPNILTSRLKTFKPRHEFLVNIGRAQYDPTKANFVSLKSLVTGNDMEFCQNVAKCSIQDYNDFLKIM